MFSQKQKDQNQPTQKNYSPNEQKKDPRKVPTRFFLVFRNCFLGCKKLFVFVFVFVMLLRSELSEEQEEIVNLVGLGKNVNVISVAGSPFLVLF